MLNSRLQCYVMDIIKPGTDLQLEWENLVESNPGAGFTQSTAWAAFKRRQGFRTVHLLIFEDRRLIGGGVGYTPPRSARAGWLVMPEGPVLPWNNVSLARECLQILVNEVHHRSSDLGAVALRVEPRIPVPLPALLRSFRRAPFDLLPDTTLCLDLSQPEQELLSAMHPKGRYNIRLAARHGVFVREERSQAVLASFYNVMLEAAARDGFSLEPLSFFQDLLNVLPEGMLRLFLAEHEDDTLAAMLMVVFGNRATYLYGGTSNRKRNMMAGYALQWHAIRVARASNCHTYDFYGYVPPCRTGHQYSRFSRFKHQFGGKPMRFVGAHDLVFVERLTDAVVRAISEVQSRTFEGRQNEAHEVKGGGGYEIA